MKQLTYHVTDSKKAVDVVLHKGLLRDPTILMPYLKDVGERFAIVCDEQIEPLYGQKLQQLISQSGFESFLYTFPAGEQHKNRASKERLEDQLFAAGLGKDTCIIALGGGVTTDLAGYVAATYCRGVPLIMMPTSLLGMVDASIGGKTGVNVPYGKNLVGCIYQPRKILIDPDALKSLSVRELRNGVAEMIKHGLILDANYFQELFQHADAILQGDSDILSKVIFESCRIKSNVVTEDEREAGKRHLLNYGHTIGHALEKISEYSIPHGEAVAIGMLVEAHLAVQLGHTHQETFEKIEQILEKYNFPLQMSLQFTSQQVIDAMRMDKKSLKGLPRFIILSKIGEAMSFGGAYCTPVDEKMILNSIAWMKDALCHN